MRSSRLFRKSSAYSGLPLICPISASTGHFWPTGSALVVLVPSLITTGVPSGLVLCSVRASCVIVSPLWVVPKSLSVSVATGA